MDAITPAKYWRENLTKIRLIGNKCDKCNSLHYPKKYLCDCGNDQMSEYKFLGKGKVVSFTEVHVSPEHLRKTVPYIIALIKLQEGPMVTTQLVECNDPKLGIEVESCVRRIFTDGEKGLIYYTTKFRPVTKK